MAQLLAELVENNNRRPLCRTVSRLLEPTGESDVPRLTTFDGRVDGEITRTRSGEGGFGYDPIFRPEGYGETFAALGPGVKNKISHRARAVAKLAAHLLGTRG